MKIAVLSGKGGTGKTTVSASLKSSIENCQYIDCDVEEPNGGIFLRPEITEVHPVMVKVPEIIKDKCTGCGECAKACQFNSMAVVKGNVLIFPELCHHCGACVLACPEDAMVEVDREIGVVETNGDGSFMHGKLNVGEPISIPIISMLKDMVKEDGNVVIDCPPGSSCSVVESVEDCDFCLLVTEPTPFGLHDLNIAVELVKKIGIPFGIVLNKASDSSRIINEYCDERGIDILMEIPFSRKIAQAYSKGILPVEGDEDLKNRFGDMFKQIEGKVLV